MYKVLPFKFRRHLCKGTMQDFIQLCDSNGMCARDVIKFSNPKLKSPKGFILIRHKRYEIYTCLQLSSLIASFFWKLPPFVREDHIQLSHDFLPF